MSEGLQKDFRKIPKDILKRGNCPSCDCPQWTYTTRLLRLVTPAQHCWRSLASQGSPHCIWPT
eukprot:11200173-Lingulodinium_polyedra.AAC.1